MTTLLTGYRPPVYGEMLIEYDGQVVKIWLPHIPEAHPILMAPGQRIRVVADFHEATRVPGRESAP